MDLNYTDLKYFIEICKCENISRASEKLGVTQPSLSAAIKRLEANTSNTLLNRSRIGVKPTKAGIELLKRSSALVKMWDDIRFDMSRLKNEPAGSYTIGCHNSVAQYTLEKFVPSLLRAYPDIVLNFHHGLSRHITESVISNKIDYGIVVNPVPHPDLVIKLLYKDAIMFWRSRKYKCGSKGHTLIYDDNLIQNQSLLSKIKSKLKIDRHITSSSLESVTKLTAAGCGIGLIPEKVAMSLSKKSTLMSDPALPSFDDRICLVFRPEQQRTQASKLIRDSILHHLIDGL